MVPVRAHDGTAHVEADASSAENARLEQPMATKHLNQTFARVFLVMSCIVAAVFLVVGGLDLFDEEASNPKCDEQCQMAPVANANMVTLMTLKEQARVDYIKERTDLGLSLTFDNSIMGTVTTCVNGFAGEYPCSNIDLHSLVSFPDLGCLGTCEGTDLWGWVDPQTGNEYALMTTTSGISVVDVTDSLAPQTVAFIATPPSGWHDVKVFNNHMFSVTEGKSGPYAGMQVFDLTRVRGRTTLANMAADLVYTHDGSLLSAHNIVINEDSGFAYVVGSNLCSGGLYMLDISSPLTPQYVGCYAEEGYTHDAQCVIYNGPHTAYNGREICFAYNTDAFTIVDVTNKSNPVMISRTVYEGSEYTHQGWLTPDMKFVLLGDELDEYKADVGNQAARTWLVDCTSLTLPIFVTELSFGVQAIDHNQYITDDWFSFQSNYMAGLRILDLKDISNIFETAFFDVDPAVNQAKFRGSWSNYPYFPSGNIIVSSMERGLFVVRPTDLSRGITIAPTPCYQYDYKSNNGYTCAGVPNSGYDTVATKSECIEICNGMRSDGKSCFGFEFDSSVGDKAGEGTCTFYASFTGRAAAGTNYSCTALLGRRLCTDTSKPTKKPTPKPTTSPTTLAPTPCYQYNYKSSNGYTCTGEHSFGYDTVATKSECEEICNSMRSDGKSCLGFQFDSSTKANAAQGTCTFYASFTGRSAAGTTYSCNALMGRRLCQI